MTINLVDLSYIVNVTVHVNALALFAQATFSWGSTFEDSRWERAFAFELGCLMNLQDCRMVCVHDDHGSCLSLTLNTNGLD